LLDASPGPDEEVLRIGFIEQLSKRADIRKICGEAAPNFYR
jgi:hypothetical protein